MLKITKYFLAALALVPALCSSCNAKEEPEQNKGLGKETEKQELVFTAILPDAPAGYKTSWSEGDQIVVYSIKDNFTSKETIGATNITDGGRKATFKSAGKLLPGASDFYAFIKDTGVKSFKLKKYWATANMDRFTEATPSVTVASCKSDKLVFEFKNLFALVEVNVTDPAVKYFTFTGNNGEVVNKSLFAAFEDMKIEGNDSPDFDPTVSIRKYVSGPGKYFIGLNPNMILRSGYTIQGFDEAGNVVSTVTNLDELEPLAGKSYVADAMAAPRELLPDFDEANIVSSFGVISDTHVDAETGAVAEKFVAALNQLKAKASEKDANGLDGILVSGDLINIKSTSQIQAFKSLYESVLDPEKVPLLYTIGNHDMNDDFKWAVNTVGNNAAIASTFGDSYFKTDIDNDMRRNYEARHCVVGGNHILAITPNGHQPIVYSPRVLSWLDEQLATLTRLNPNKYVILLTHPMIENTIYGSLLGTSVGGIWTSAQPDYWSTAALTSVLNKYPQVVSFHGHLHFPLNDPRSIWQGGWTAMGCGSVKYMAIEPAAYEDMAGATVMKDNAEFSQGNLVQIDINGNMRITRMDFWNNSTIGEALDLRYPDEAGANLTRYTDNRKNLNQAPSMGAITVETSGDENTPAVSVQFPAGTDDEFVHHYVVRLNKEDGQAVVTKRILADFYRQAPKCEKKTSYTVELGTAPEAGKYEVSVVAVDSWDAESAPATKEIHAGPPAPDPTDKWVGDEAYEENLPGQTVASISASWLTYDGTSVKAAANTSGKPRSATITFSNGVTYKLTQIGAADFKGDYSFTAKFFANAPVFKPAGNKQTIDVTFGAPLLGETLNDAAGKSHTNQIGIKGLYFNDFTVDACIDIDYEAKKVKLGVFMDGRKAQLISSISDAFKYAACLPGLGSRWTAPNAFSAPWLFVAPDFNPDYEWLWIDGAMDEESGGYVFSYTANSHPQQLTSQNAYGPQLIVGLSIVRFKGEEASAANANSTYSQVYQFNTDGTNIGIVFRQK